jgi:transmembrane sensor
MAGASDRAREEVIAEAAAGWVARLSSRDASEEDRRRFEAWQAQSPDHAIAFEEMNALWGDLAQVPKSVVPGRRRVGSGIAAALVIGFLAYLAEEAGLIDRFRADYYTPVGGIRTVSLEDGSVVTLNTDSAIQVKYDQAQRHIVLLRGEAFFDVAPNPTRPFVVSGKESEATALGTHYAVRVGDHDAVMVEEGHVAVTAGEQRAVLEAGGTAEVDDGRLTTGTADVADLTSWRSGKLVFSGQPLGKVLAELGRYRHGRIMVLDDTAAQLRVSGVFDLKTLDQSLPALQESLPIRLNRLPGVLTIIRSR